MQDMEIVCQNCDSKFRISGQRLPPEHMTSAKCSKCGSRIQINANLEAPTAKGARNLETMANEVNSSNYDASEKPFDYVHVGTKTALLCEYDLQLKEKIRTVLERRNHHVVEAASARYALKYMRFHVYDLVVLNETFDAPSTESNHVLHYLAQLPMSIRRDVFVILLSDSFRTMDNMMAFNKSVNLVVNLQDIDDMENILKGALIEHNRFYRVFKEVLTEAGRA